MGFVKFLPVFVLFTALNDTRAFAQTVPYALEFDDRYYKELKAKKPKTDADRFQIWRSVHPMSTTVNPKKTAEPATPPTKVNQPSPYQPNTPVAPTATTVIQTVTQDGNLDELIFPEDDTPIQKKKPANKSSRKSSRKRNRGSKK